MAISGCNLSSFRYIILALLPSCILGCSADTATATQGTIDAASETADAAECMCTGEPGAQGPQGEQGLVGPQGPAGAQGLQGLAGAPGEAGIQGPAGEEGPQGLAGATGPAGAPGSQGATGAPGIQGPRGNDGPAGLALKLASASGVVIGFPLSVKLKTTDAYLREAYFLHQEAPGPTFPQDYIVFREFVAVYYYMNSSCQGDSYMRVSELSQYENTLYRVQVGSSVLMDKTATTIGTIAGSSRANGGTCLTGSGPNTVYVKMATSPYAFNPELYEPFSLVVE